MDASLVVLTGAGISADSGLSTFRGGGGLWEGHDVMDVATPEAWARDPALVWRFYQMRRANLKTVEPNAAHLALARLEKSMERAGLAFTLVSQNVDDLHRRAGSTVISMHGRLDRLRCEVCAHVEDDLESLDEDRFVACSECAHSRLRPDIVWFGEMPMNLDVIDRAVSRCTHFVAIGTSGVVYPAAGYLAAARSRGAKTIVQSLDEPDNLHGADRFVAGKAKDAVPALVDEWFAEWRL